MFSDFTQAYLDPVRLFWYKKKYSELAFFASLLVFTHMYSQYFNLWVNCTEDYLKHLNLKNQVSFILFLSFSDALQETLGFDWLLLFLQAHLHNTTVVRATRILVTMLSLMPTLNRFKDGLCTGSWLDGTDIILNKTTYVVAGKDNKVLQ